MAITAKDNKNSEDFAEEFRGQMLDWYDRHRRILPWRAPKGKKPNSYHVWLSEIMLQQTTVGAVQPYFLKFVEKWPDVRSLADADTAEIMKEWAGLGYYARARNLHACAKVVAYELNGVFPADLKALKALPGIGEYTGAAIRAIAFNKSATVVDGNVERVMARYFAVEEPLPKSKPLLKHRAAETFEGYEERPGDLAQALMDLGATVCIAKTPRCGLCPLSSGCEGRKRGNAETLPRKEKKKARPRKTGYVYWIENEQGQILLHRRPTKGLLGGMVALPTSEWVKSAPKPLGFIAESEFGKFPAISHIFTHFELELVPRRARLKTTNLPGEGEYFWSDIPQENETGFPTVFQKAFLAFIRS